jgi:hypothetical protein
MAKDDRFKGIFIPACILQIDDLCGNAKILLAHIYSYTSRGGECYASNGYMQEKFLRISTRQISKHLSLLIEKNYVFRDSSEKSRKRYLRANIKFIEQNAIQKEDTKKENSKKERISTYINVIKIKNNNPEDSGWDEEEADIDGDDVDENDEDTLQKYTNQRR